MVDVNSLNEYMNYIYILKNRKTNNKQKKEFFLMLFDKTNGNLKNNLSISMALIHPEFPEMKKESRNGFTNLLADNCQLGFLIKGAKCPNPASQKDHIFPYSLGGITEDRNRADLCESCNRGKSNTVVGYFPWHQKTPDWVIEKIHLMLSKYR